LDLWGGGEILKTYATLDEFLDDQAWWLGKPTARPIKEEIEQEYVPLTNRQMSPEELDV
jgi:hypothetical protein